MLECHLISRKQRIPVRGLKHTYSQSSGQTASKRGRKQRIPVRGLKPDRKGYGQVDELQVENNESP